MIPSIYTQLAYYSWIALFIVWFIGNFRNKRTVQVPKWGEQIVVLVLLILSFGLLFTVHASLGSLEAQLYMPNAMIGLFGVLLACAGVIFAIWARITLGSNWSGTVVTIKKDHELVQSGPYAYVRHPIYSGFLAAALGTAITITTLSAFIAVILMLIAFLIRVRREESMMIGQFPDEYPKYKKRTKMLIPFIL